MTLFHGMLTRLRRRAQGSEPRPLVTFPRLLSRHWIASSLVVVLLIGLGYLAWPNQPPKPQPQKCGRGLTAIGSPYVCVGLDLDSTALQKTDPLADLEKTVAADNRAISGPFATIVVFQDLTPDPRNDNVAISSQRHAIEGAITAVSRQNDPTVSGANPKIKLLLANYGLGADAWPQAVDAIKRAVPSEHIVAVTGIGESRDTTRAAVAALSDAGIAIVGADVTADNMNTAPGPGGKRSTNFFRVVSPNSEEAIVAANYIKQRSYRKMLLIKDVNERDSYVKTLGDAFAANVKVDNVEPYRSPDKTLSVTTRKQVMAAYFAQMHSDICAIRPDLIYFAGRGIDLESFLTAMSSSGSCGLGPIDVLTGDDAENLVGEKISTSGDLSFTVFYTALAHTDQWSGLPSDSDYAKNYQDYVKNYQDFAAAFFGEHFAYANLDDGEAMVSHDAVLAAVLATKADPEAIVEPNTVPGSLVLIHCQNYVPGASGPIAFSSDGNPIDKAMPILQLHADGTVTQKDLVWSAGKPFDPNSTCH